MFESFYLTKNNFISISIGIKNIISDYIREQLVLETTDKKEIEGTLHDIKKIHQISRNEMGMRNFSILGGSNPNLVRRHIMDFIPKLDMKANPFIPNYFKKNNWIYTHNVTNDDSNLLFPGKITFSYMINKEVMLEFVTKIYYYENSGAGIVEILPKFQNETRFGCYYVFMPLFNKIDCSYITSYKRHGNTNSALKSFAIGNIGNIGGALKSFALTAEGFDWEYHWIVSHAPTIISRTDDLLKDIIIVDMSEFNRTHSIRKSIRNR